MKYLQKFVCLMLCVTLLTCLSSQSILAEQKQISLVKQEKVPLGIVTISVPVTYNVSTNYMKRVGTPSVYLSGCNFLYSVRYISKIVNYSKNHKKVYIDVTYQTSSPVWTWTYTEHFKFNGHGGRGGKF